MVVPMPLHNPRLGGRRRACRRHPTRFGVVLLVLLASWWPLAPAARAADAATGSPEPAPQAMRTDTARPSLATVPVADAPAPPDGTESAGAERLESEAAPVDPFVLIGV